MTRRVVCFLACLLYTSILWAQESKSAPSAAAPPIPLSEVEQLRVKNLALEIDKLDAQIQLLQERKTRLQQADAKTLIDVIYKSHGVTPEEYSLNLQAMRFEKIEPKAEAAK